MGYGTRYNSRIITINGTTYESVKAAAEALGTNSIQLSKKIKRMTELGYDTTNFDLESYNKLNRHRKGYSGYNGPGIDILCYNYKNLNDFATKNGINVGVVYDRVHKGWDLELLGIKKPLEKMQISLKFRGVNGKAYYTVTGVNGYKTAREILQIYHPELVHYYDICNPTGEYRPYKRG